MASRFRSPVGGSRPLSPRLAASRGFTLIELMTVVVVLGGLATMAFARTQYTIKQAKFAKAIGDIRAITQDIQAYSASAPAQAFPPTLNDVDRSALLDPWGRPYRYVLFTSGGTPRTDIFGINLNSSFDVYSSGPDGTSATSITAGPSIDDVVLAGDGGFIGKASRY